jgi:hypothetical protein
LGCGLEWPGVLERISESARISECAREPRLPRLVLSRINDNRQIVGVTMAGVTPPAEIS